MLLKAASMHGQSYSKSPHTETPLNKPYSNKAAVPADSGIHAPPFQDTLFCKIAQPQEYILM